MEVYIIPMLGDNLCYYVTRDVATKPGILIDVSEPQKVLEFLHAMGITVSPSHVMTTHKHYDHAGGNEEIKNLIPGLEVLGGLHDNIPGATQGLENEQVLELNDIRIRCFHTPCHTRGHMLYYFEPVGGAQEAQVHSVEKLAQGYQVTRSVNRCVFTGDTIFEGGCGRFFEGEPHEMVAAMAIARDVLPPDTKMFNGHEYADQNLKFCASVDPDNAAVQTTKHLYEAQRAEGFWTAPSTLAAEKTYNVFMRCFDADIQAITATSNPVDCMRFLREWKNSG